jgi:hypothetical protein
MQTKQNRQKRKKISLRKEKQQQIENKHKQMFGHFDQNLINIERTTIYKRLL